MGRVASARWCGALSSHELLASSHASLYALVRLAFRGPLHVSLASRRCLRRPVPSRRSAQPRSTRPLLPKTRLVPKGTRRCRSGSVFGCRYALALTCSCERRFPPVQAAAPAIFLHQRRQAHASPHRSPGRMRRVPRASTTRSSSPRWCRLWMRRELPNARFNCKSRACVRSSDVQQRDSRAQRKRSRRLSIPLARTRFAIPNRTS